MFEYERGYHKAFIDLTNFYKHNELAIKSFRANKKQEVFFNLIKHLTLNRNERDIFMRYGGDTSTIVISTLDQKVTFGE